jgi:hypothetical protein
MNPQQAYALALDRARDVRRDAEQLSSVAMARTTKNRSLGAFRAPGTTGRPSFFRRLRVA